MIRLSLLVVVAVIGLLLSAPTVRSALRCRLQEEKEQRGATRLLVAVSVGACVVVAAAGVAAGVVVSRRNASPQAEAKRILDRQERQAKVQQAIAAQEQERGCAAENERPPRAPGLSDMTPDGVPDSSGTRSWAITDWRWGTPPPQWQALGNQVVNLNGEPAYASLATGGEACWSPRALELLSSGRATACGNYADAPGTFCSDHRGA
ncbi:MAG: hypothetical protein LC808_03455 [Actinobacteria bacterium]|nr:hypothetical protein [Actinomycetota bacterium]